MNISVASMQVMLDRNSKEIAALEDMAVFYKDVKMFKNYTTLKKDIARLAKVQRELKIALRRQDLPTKFKFTYGDDEIFHAKKRQGGFYYITWQGNPIPSRYHEKTVKEAIKSGIWKMK